MRFRHAQTGQYRRPRQRLTVVVGLIEPLSVTAMDAATGQPTPVRLRVTDAATNNANSRRSLASAACGARGLDAQYL